MIKVGKISSQFYSPIGGRVMVDKLHLDTKGILNDKHYDKDVSRSVLIASLESYAIVNRYGISVPYGTLGENILMDYNPYHLPEGSKLKIANVVLEISQHCTLCKSLGKVDGQLPKLLKNDRGIFAKVIESGSISNGDDIYILDE